MGDTKYPEFWAASVLHDLAYEGINTKEHMRILNEHFEGIVNNNERDRDWSAKAAIGEMLVEVPGTTDFLTRRQADRLINHNMKLIVSHVKHNLQQRRRAWQLNLARQQRMCFLRTPEPIKRAFLWINRLFGGA
jgi:hypothetical protein